MDSIIKSETFILLRNNKSGLSMTTKSVLIIFDKRSVVNYFTPLNSQLGYESMLLLPYTLRIGDFDMCNNTLLP